MTTCPSRWRAKSVSEVLSDIVEHGGCEREPARLRTESGESVTGARARVASRWDSSTHVSTSLCIYFHQHRDLLHLLLDLPHLERSGGR